MEFTCIERLVDGESASDEADNGISLGRQDGVWSIPVTDASARAILVDEKNDEQTLNLEADFRRAEPPFSRGGWQAGQESAIAAGTRRHPVPRPAEEHPTAPGPPSVL